MDRSAHQNESGVWIYPQCYCKNGKKVSKKSLLAQIDANPFVQEALQIEPQIARLIEQATQQRCIYGYDLLKTFYDYYKPQIVNLVGWGSPHQKIRTMKHYDAVYEAIYDLLPCDEAGLYPEGIMPNGLLSPQLQEQYGREYP